MSTKLVPQIASVFTLGMDKTSQKFSSEINVNVNKVIDKLSTQVDSIGRMRVVKWK